MPDEPVRGRTNDVIAEEISAALDREPGINLDEIDIDDNFLELGGTSILAMKVGAAVDAIFGVEVPVFEIYRHPTIRRAGAYIDSLIVK